MRIIRSIVLLAGLWCWAADAINNEMGLTPEDQLERDRLSAQTNRSFSLGEC